MPNKYNIPTEEQQDNWEQTVLVPKMFNNFTNQIDYYIENSKRLDKEIEILEKRQAERYKNKQSKKNKMVKDVKGSGIKSNNTKVVHKYDKLISDLDQLLDVKTVDQEYDTLMKKADQLVKTKTKRKMIKDTSSMLDDIPEIKKTSSKKSKVIGDILNLMTDSHLSKTSIKEPKSFDNIVSDINKSIKQKKSRAKRAKISETVSDLLTTQPEVKDTKSLSKASKQAKSIINDIDNFLSKKTTNNKSQIDKYYIYGVGSKKTNLFGKGDTQSDAINNTKSNITNIIDKIDSTYMHLVHIKEVSPQEINDEKQSKIKMIGGPVVAVIKKILVDNTQLKIDDSKGEKIYFENKNIDESDIKKVVTNFVHGKYNTGPFAVNVYNKG